MYNVERHFIRAIQEILMGGARCTRRREREREDVGVTGEIRWKNTVWKTKG